MGKETESFPREKSVLAQRLAELRGTATTEDYAKRYGMKRQQWERYENDRALPMVSLLIKIANAEGVGIDWLLGRYPARALPPIEESAPSRALEGAAVPHIVSLAQGRVWQLYRQGEDNPGWQLLLRLLDLYVPEEAAKVPPPITRPDTRAAASRRQAK